MITDKTNQPENNRQDLQDMQDTRKQRQNRNYWNRNTGRQIQEYSESRDKHTHIPKDELATNHRQVWTINTLGNATFYVGFWDVRRRLNNYVRWETHEGNTAVTGVDEIRGLESQTSSIQIHSSD